MTVSVVDTKEMSLDEARNSGATCLFDEKYAEKVRVVSVGDFSKELCGGTHVANSGEIGLFKIVSESGVAAGIRRIEAVTGISALKFMELKNNMLKEAASMLKCNEKDIAKRIAAQAHELKEKDKEIAELKAKLVQRCWGWYIKRQNWNKRSWISYSRIKRCWWKFIKRFSW